MIKVIRALLLIVILFTGFLAGKLVYNIVTEEGGLGGMFAWLWMIAWIGGIFLVALILWIVLGFVGKK